MNVKEWIWRGISLRLPDDWEMLKYSRVEEQGGCCWMDRYHQRLELSWRVLEGEPDLGRMVRDYGGKLENAQEFSHVGYNDVAGWKGLRARKGDLHLSRFLKFFAEGTLLVECVFHHIFRREADLERNVLASVQLPEPKPMGSRSYMPWRAYEMTWICDSGLPFTECEVRPGHVQVAFGNEARKRGRESFSRIGLVSQWLRVGVDEWLQAKLPLASVTRGVGHRSEHGHDIHRAEGEAKWRRSMRLGTVKGNFTTEAWICPRDGRLYHGELEYVSREKEYWTEIAGRRLQCCGAW